MQSQKLPWVPPGPHRGVGAEDCPALGTPPPEGLALVEILQHGAEAQHAPATSVNVASSACLKDPHLVHEGGCLCSLAPREQKKKR